MPIVISIIIIIFTAKLVSSLAAYESGHMEFGVDNYNSYRALGGRQRISHTVHILLTEFIRVFDNPFTKDHYIAANYILTYIVPSLVDYIAQSESEDVSFQLLIVDLIERCLHLEMKVGNDSILELCRQSDIMNFLWAIIACWVGKLCMR